MDDLPHILLTPMQAEAAAADGISGRTHAHGTGNVWLSLTLRAVSALTDIAADLGERLRASIADDGLGTDAVLGLPDNGQTLLRPLSTAKFSWPWTSAAPRGARHKKTRPTRSRVVYARTITRIPCGIFHQDDWSCYQPTGRRYWPTGSGGPMAAQTPRTVVQIEAVYVHSDTHQRKVALIQQIPCQPGFGPCT